MRKKKGLEVAVNAGLIVILVILNTPAILASYSLLAASDLVNSDYRFKIIIGRSMTPVITHGDTILIKKGVEGIGVGDIISFKVDSMSLGVTHRVIDIQEDPVLIFHTKGDANEIPDNWRITVDQVKGKVVQVIPTSLLITPQILYTSILLPAIGISARAVYCFSKKNTQIQESKYPVLNLTTILSAVFMAFSVGRLLVIMLLIGPY